MQQILCLGKQIFLGRSSFFMDAFYKATNEPFGYLLIDINPYSDRRYQLRTKILPGEDTRIYLPLNETIKKSSLIFKVVHDCNQ